jgi:hypothetical protein
MIPYVSPIGSEKRGSSTLQIADRLFHALGHRSLYYGQIRRGILRLLAPYLPVNLQNAVIVLEHVIGDCAGEGILQTNP